MRRRGLRAVVRISSPLRDSFGYEAPAGIAPKDALPHLLKLLAARCAARSDPEWVLREVAYIVGEDVGEKVDKVLDERAQEGVGGIVIGDVFGLVGGGHGDAA